MNLHTKKFARGFVTTATRLLFTSAILLLAFMPHASAQETDAPPHSQRPDAGRRDSRERGHKLFEQLSLTPEQVRQLREIRTQNEVEGRTLLRRLHETRRALDEAIYADALDETVIEQRTREVEAAQAALVRLRALTELRVRRTLTPEQLQTFKALRQEARRRQRERRRDGGPGERHPERRRRGRDAFSKP